MEVKKKLWSASLLRKTTKKFVFFVVSLKDDASHFPGLFRKLAAGPCWKETQSFGIPLGKLESSNFRFNTSGRVMITLALIGKDILPCSVLFHVLACCNSLCLTLFALSWAGETRSGSHMIFKNAKKKQKKKTLLGWVRRFSEPWEMTSTLAERPNNNEKRLQVPWGCYREQPPICFILHCYPWPGRKP